MGALRVLAFAAGAVIVLRTVMSAVRTFVVPRPAPVVLTRLVFVASRRLFAVALARKRTDRERDDLLALFAPLTLLLLPGAWLALVLSGYTAMHWAVEADGWRRALEVSGSSLLTLGFARPHGMAATLLALAEAAMGVGLLALLITYLPTMYGAFARRETAVSLLEVRAGTPPSAVEMIVRFHTIHGLDELDELWSSWESWFADVEESHTSLASLPHFRSPRPGRSWVTAAGAILDAASLRVSTLDLPGEPSAELCIRAGYLALRHIADFFAIPHDDNPGPATPISITRQEFDEALDLLAGAGVPLRHDREKAWADFRGWRVNYDTVLIALAGLVTAPPAPWSSDRAVAYKRPPFRRRA